MKIKKTLILVFILALLGLTTVITITKSHQSIFQDGDDLPCLQLTTKNQIVYAENTCSESKRFTVIIYTDSGFSKGFTNCLRQGEIQSVANIKQNYRVAQQQDC